MTKLKTRLALASVSALADPERYAQALARVSPQRREQIASFRVEGAKRLSLGAALLLDRLLADAGLGPAGGFAFGEQGKPYLPDRPGVHFSLSHSGEHVLCALADAEIGCDVESLRKVDLALAPRFFHPEEAAWLLSLLQREQKAAFLRLWTLKESYIKALGLGLTLPLNEFRILPVPGGWALTHAEDPRPWRLRAFEAADCFCAVCAEEPPETLERLTLFE
ncbi:MAG: 4'-phosphopantetheinyl transferase superfamily protein [Oscillospiraceae bacterium]|nr:4'-phosphopantetheinyl transferase superfamily protein [Oscillospiraceae bacterium]